MKITSRCASTVRCASFSNSRLISAICSATPGFQRADALNHQRYHQDQRQQHEPGANTHDSLEFGPFAVEVNP